jgi:hypothetical protein
MVREAEFPIDKKAYILLLYSKASRERKKRWSILELKSTASSWGETGTGWWSFPRSARRVWFLLLISYLFFFFFFTQHKNKRKEKQNNKRINKHRYDHLLLHKSFLKNPVGNRNQELKWRRAEESEYRRRKEEWQYISGWGIAALKALHVCCYLLAFTTTTPRDVRLAIYKGLASKVRIVVSIFFLIKIY